MSRHFFSVLTSVYNGGDKLRQSIESVLRQTHGNFEFVIVDDKSTDGSVALIESYNDKRIVLYKNEQNIGQSASLNKGLQSARGEYIARIDADDLALPNWLERLVDAKDRCQKAAVISPAVAVIDEHNIVRKQYFLPREEGLVLLRSMIRTPVNHVGSLINREIALELGGYNEKFRVAADFDLWGKMLRSNRQIVTVDEVLMAIREHSQSLSRVKSIEGDLPELAEIMLKNIEFLSSKELTAEQSKLLARSFYEPEGMNISDFEGALRLFNQILDQIKPFVPVSSGKAASWQKEVIKNVVARKIFADIEGGNYNDIRSASRLAQGYLGGINLFSVFYVCSFLNGLVLPVVPKLHRAYIRRRSCQQVKKYQSAISIG